ncbi:hypothetical protein ACGE0T_02300 [Parabacteroides sp. APC149_11_2_Y6]
MHPWINGNDRTAQLLMDHL